MISKPITQIGLKQSFIGFIQKWPPVFFVIYILYTPNDCIPYTEIITKFYLNIIRMPVACLAEKMLHLPTPLSFQDTGSADRLCDYVIVCFSAFISSIIALIWTMIDRREHSYKWLTYWFWVIVRFYLAFNMFSYGFAKIIKIQFPYPSLYRLVEPFGAASPMGLAWTYMGYSSGFNYFTGFAEVICGVFLLWRRTCTLGALLSFMVTLNITAINYFYDVPVKLLATLLLLMSVYLLAGDAKRLVNFFFVDRDATPVTRYTPAYTLQWQRYQAALKYLLITYTITAAFIYMKNIAGEYGDQASKPLLYGLYEVKIFKVNKTVIQPMTTNTIRWRKLIIGAAGSARIIMMNDSSKKYMLNLVAERHQISFSQPADSLHPYQFNYLKDKRGNLYLKGKHLSDSLTLDLEKVDINKYQLINRGFHWITEYPYNR